MEGWVNSCYEGTREKFKSPLDVKVEASGSQSLAHMGCMRLKRIQKWMKETSKSSFAFCITICQSYTHRIQVCAAQNEIRSQDSW